MMKQCSARTLDAVRRRQALTSSITKGTDLLDHQALQASGEDGYESDLDGPEGPMRAPSSALPRWRVLWTNWKKPTATDSFSHKMPLVWFSDM
jgi:hypothetical protein